MPPVVRCAKCGEWLEKRQAKVFQDEYYHEECLDGIKLLQDILKAYNKGG